MEKNSAMVGSERGGPSSLGMLPLNLTLKIRKKLVEKGERSLSVELKPCT